MAAALETVGAEAVEEVLAALLTGASFLAQAAAKHTTPAIAATRRNGKDLVELINTFTSLIIKLNGFKHEVQYSKFNPLICLLLLRTLPCHKKIALIIEFLCDVGQVPLSVF